MMLATDTLGAFTAVVVAVIGVGGSVWATIISVRTKRTKGTVDDVQSKVNGRLDQLLETNKRLTDTLVSYMLGEWDRRRGE